jgi:hypothetical protein
LVVIGREKNTDCGGYGCRCGRRAGSDIGRRGKGHGRLGTGLGGIVGDFGQNRPGELTQIVEAKAAGVGRVLGVI